MPDLPKKEIENPPTHETRDVNARAVLWFAGGLAMVTVLVFVFVRALIGYFDSRVPGKMDRITTPRLKAPEPRLQTDPARELEMFRARQNEILSNYGWVDRDAGIVRIPIDRAMDLIVERGLPAARIGSGKTPLQMRQEKSAAAKSSP